MKTKMVLPWKLKPGDTVRIETIPREFCADGFPQKLKVRNVVKDRGCFTGATTWRVHLENGEQFLLHGKMRSLPPDKIQVVIP